MIKQKSRGGVKCQSYAEMHGKRFKMFANDDFEYMLPVLTTVTLNVLTRTMKKEVDGSNKQTNEMFV